MGIEKFFNSIAKNITIKKNNLLTTNKCFVEYLYIDFNSILYKIANTVEKEINAILYELIDGDITNDVKKLSEELGYDITKFDVKHFREYFSDNFIEKRMIKLVQSEIYYILDVPLESSIIKYIYISIDGIPNMAKIIEQKKRRYMNYILNESKKEIYAKIKMKLDSNRKIFETNKIKFSRNKIIGHHEFMINLTQYLKTDTFINSIKTKYKYLETYVCTDGTNPGEGEKKIMESILSHKPQGSIVIYSPDADVIILSSILLNKLDNGSRMHVCRYDQNDDRHDVIDINKLCDNIYTYITKTIQKKTDKNVSCNKINITNDIMFIFTMFGNDFVHKIESINPKKDYEIILNSYVKFIIESNEYVLGSGSINSAQLLKYLSIIQDYEKDMINDTYMIDTFRNYKAIKNKFLGTFWFDTLHRTLMNYFGMANIVFKHINKWSKLHGSNIISKNIGYMLNELLKYDATNYLGGGYDISLKRKILQSKKLIGFLNSFLRVEFNVYVTDRRQIYDTFVNNIKNRSIVKTPDSTVIFTPQLRFEEYSRSTDDEYHVKNMQKLLISEKCKITEYDKEIYAFEHMLDEYREKLNATNDQIGKTSLEYIGNMYVYTHDTLEKYHDKYYDLYFEETTRDEISKKYYEGICWVHDFYFNKNDNIVNYDKVSFWYYDLNKSPLITDVYKYIKNQTTEKLQEIYDNVTNRTVSRNNFLNSTQHSLYVTPKNIIKWNEKLINFVNSNPDIFPDLDSIVTAVMNNSDTSFPIDCRRASYITKCHIKAIRDVKFDVFMEKTKDVALNDNNSTHIEQYTKSYDVHDKDGRQVLFDRFYGKKKYLQTGSKSFKKIYKIAKMKLK